MSKYWFGQPSYVESWYCANLVPLTVNGSIILELTRSILSVAWYDGMRNFLSTFQTDSKTYHFYNFKIFTQIIIFHTNYFGIWNYWAQSEDFPSHNRTGFTQ